MSEQPKNELRTLVIGAGATGSMTIERMRSGKSDMPGMPVVAVDDNEEKIGTLVSGIKVAGACEEIPRIVKERNIAQIVSPFLPPHVRSVRESMTSASKRKCASSLCLLRF